MDLELVLRKHELSSFLCVPTCVVDDARKYTHNLNIRTKWYIKKLRWEESPECLQKFHIQRDRKLSSFPNFSLLAGCLQALITWAERCTPSAAFHQANDWLSPFPPNPPFLPGKLPHKLPLRGLTSITVGNNTLVFHCLDA